MNTKTIKGDEEKNSLPDQANQESQLTGQLTGRELDAAIAERVMGWHRLTDFDYKPPQEDWVDARGEFQAVENTEKQSGWLCCWSPSTDIAAAMEVVTALRHGFAFQAFHYPSLSSAGIGWRVAFAHRITPFDFRERRDVFAARSDDSLPEAICRAALLAVADTQECASASALSQATG